MFLVFLLIAIAQCVRLIYVEREFHLYKVHQQQKTLDNLRALNFIDSLVPEIKDKETALKYTNEMIKLAEKL